MSAEKRFSPSPNKDGERYKTDRPKGVKDVPAWLFRTVKSFCSRFFYIIRLVWETSPAILLLMTFCCLCDGFLPVFGAYVSKDLLNAVSELLHTEEVLQGINAGIQPIESIFAPAFQTVLLLLWVPPQ